MSSHPIYVAPDSAQYTNFTEAMATKLLAGITAEPTITNKKLGMSTGSFSDQGVDFTYSYQAPAQTLEINIVAVHSLKAKIAGHETIFEVLDKAVQTYLAS